MSAVQLRMQPMVQPIAALVPLGIDEANDLLVRWGHRLGPCRRPFHQEAHALLGAEGEPVSLTVSASIVNGPVAGYGRGEVVELARLCSAPGAHPMTRVMMRLWRELCAPAWPCWPVAAAVSYSQNSEHRGDVYRFDGWEKVREDAGCSTGSAGWSKRTYATPAHRGPKTLWLWRYGREGAA